MVTELQVYMKTVAKYTILRGKAKSVLHEQLPHKIRYQSLFSHSRQHTMSGANNATLVIDKGGGFIVWYLARYPKR